MVPPQTGGAQLQLRNKTLWTFAPPFMISTDSLRDRRTEPKSVFAIFELLMCFLSNHSVFSVALLCVLFTQIFSLSLTLMFNFSFWNFILLN